MWRHFPWMRGGGGAIIGVMKDEMCCDRVCIAWEGRGCFMYNHRIRRREDMGCFMLCE